MTGHERQAYRDLHSIAESLEAIARALTRIERLYEQQEVPE